jgi:AAA family ATP:ADP antiporter
LPDKWTTYIAMMGAALMLGHQVAGKAVRDSFFLSNYPASDLPKAVMAAAVLSILIVLIFARLMGRFGPLRLVPIGFLLSSILHFTEYLHVNRLPAQWSLVIYFHIVALGAVLLSGFWSLMAELFDPRAAKHFFGRIAGFGTLGGIAGGLLAERIAALSSATAVLLLLSLLHLACSMILMSARRTAPPPPPLTESEILSPIQLVRRAPLLGMIALTVLAGTSSAVILDYLFKAGASNSIGKGADLLRFFAAFYITTQILTFLAQTFLARPALQHLGIGRTISSLPIGVGFGALGALLIPVFPMFAAIRSAEFVLRGSLYRSAYELLFTPVAPAEKRAAKTLIDVGCDRAGDALGGGIVQLLLWMSASVATSALLGFALAMAAAGIWICLKLDAAYTKLVQQRLVDRAVEFDLAEIQDTTTRSVFLRVPANASATKPAPPNLSTAAPRATDATLEAMRELRSGDSRRILAAIKELQQPSPPIAAQLLRLLAWDEVRDAIQEALERNPNPITGLLIDHLTNPEVQFGIRRRIPRILARCDSQLAVYGLLAGLEDNRFEVRFQCSRALDSLVLRRPELKVPSEVIFAAVERELKVAHPIWNSRRLLDKREETDKNAFLDEVLRERADQSLEHIFSLFATVLPREPIKIAFRVLHTDNKTLRGLAAEYLDSILPENIRERLWMMVEPALAQKRTEGESGQEALDKLLRSHESLMLIIDKESSGQ